MDITASFDGATIIEDVDPLEDLTPPETPEEAGWWESKPEVEIPEIESEDDKTYVPDPDAPPTEDEILQFATETGSFKVQDENVADGEDLNEESYQRYLRVLDKACPLPDDFPTSEERTELMKKFGRLRIRRLAPGEAYLVRPIRRLDMPTYYRIQQEASKFEDAAEAEIWYENEIAATFCLYPEVTEEALTGTGVLAMGGTVEMIARDIMAISNLATNTDVGMVEDL